MKQKDSTSQAAESAEIHAIAKGNNNVSAPSAVKPQLRAPRAAAGPLPPLFLWSRLRSKVPRGLLLSEK